jgi:hypothetical protein
MAEVRGAWLKIVEDTLRGPEHSGLKSAEEFR